MTIESIEKRERRLKRTRREIAVFRHALRFMPPIEALKHIVGFSATWHAVRRVASEAIATDVQDVMVAWGIVYFIAGLPDGAQRLQAATDAALAKWEQEIEA